MKVRLDFVTNSSSSSFVITNKTNEIKTIEDLFRENTWLYEKGYGENHDNDTIFEHAKRMNVTFAPYETKTIECEDSYSNLAETYIHNNLCQKLNAVSMIQLCAHIMGNIPEEYLNQFMDAKDESESFSWEFGESHH